MWVGNRCYPPKDVELALESLFGESVRQVKVIQYSIFVRFHWRAIATTRPNRIYLRGSGKEFFADGPLVLHEYFHVLRQWATGDLTIPRYLRNVSGAATGTIATRSKRANSPPRKSSAIAHCWRSTAARRCRRACGRSRNRRSQPNKASRRYSRPARYISSTP